MENNIKPEGTGYFGEIYKCFKYKVKEAFDFLVQNKKGDLLSVFHRDDIGDIDMVWGDDSCGLCHIINKHIKEKDFKNIEDIRERITEIINKGKIEKDNPEKVIIYYDDYYVIVRKNIRDKGKFKYLKNWIVTSYNQKEEISSDATLATPSINKEDRAVVLDEISRSKGKNKKPKNKKKKKKNLKGIDDNFKIGDWVKYRNGLTIMKIIEIKGRKAKLSYDIDDHWHDFNTLSKAEAPENKYNKYEETFLKGWLVRILQFGYDPISKQMRYIVTTLGSGGQKFNCTESQLEESILPKSHKVGEKIALVDSEKKGKIIIYQIVGIEGDDYICKLEEFYNTSQNTPLVKISFRIVHNLYVPFAKVPSIVNKQLVKMDIDIVSARDSEKTRLQEIRKRLYEEYCNKVIDLQLTELSFLN